MTVLETAANRHTLAWSDPTFDAVWLRMQAPTRRCPVVIVHHVGPMFWAHTGWTNDLRRAVLYSHEGTAWLIAECCQDGDVTVERISDLQLRRAARPT
jgi:hypothetical protein